MGDGAPSSAYASRLPLAAADERSSIRRFVATLVHFHLFFRSKTFFNFSALILAISEPPPPQKTRRAPCSNLEHAHVWFLNNTYVR